MQYYNCTDHNTLYIVHEISVCCNCKQIRLKVHLTVESDVFHQRYLSIALANWIRCGYTYTRIVCIVVEIWVGLNRVRSGFFCKSCSLVSYNLYTLKLGGSKCSKGLSWWWSRVCIAIFGQYIWCFSIDSC